MRPIDRIIVKVNDKVYSFLDPLLLDETERPYCSNDGIVNKLAVSSGTISNPKIYRLYSLSNLL